MEFHKVEKIVGPNPTIDTKDKVEKSAMYRTGEVSATTLVFNARR